MAEANPDSKFFKKKSIRVAGLSSLKLGLLVFFTLLLITEFSIVGITSSKLSNHLSLLAFSLTPSLFLASYVVIYEGVSKKALVGTFIASIAFSAVPAAVNPLINVLALGTMMAIIQLIIVPVEEVAKLASVTFFRNSIEKPMDGAAFGAMAGLAFALVENIFYVTGAGAGIEMAVTRAVAASGHVIFSTVAGYFFATAYFKSGAWNKLKTVMKGMGIAMAFHLVYNYIAIIMPVIPSVVAAGILVTFFVVAGGYFTHLIEKESKTPT
ncbi:MAG: PrsW family intramembrane metalloprotease [Halobacteria archaeon]